MLPTVVSGSHCAHEGCELGEVNTFEGRQFLQLPVVAQAEARGALPLVLFDRCLGTWLLPLQQLRGGRDIVAALPIGARLRGEKICMSVALN